MMAFSATDAVFEGFRVVRRHPMTLVYWTLFYIAAFAVAMAVIGGDLIQLISLHETLDTVGQPSPEEFSPLLQIYARIFVVVLPVSLLTAAVVYSAVARAVLRPEESQYGYLRFGADELRVLAVIFVLGLIFMAFVVALSTLIGVLAGVAAAMGAPWILFVAVLLGLGAIAAGVWLAVRLSLAVPITMAERRIRLFESYQLTKGRFWPLLGMAVMAAVLSIVVGLLGTLVLTPLQLLSGGVEQLSAVEGQGIVSMLQSAWPVILVWILTNAIVSSLQVAVIYAPFSSAYLALTERRGQA